MNWSAESIRQTEADIVEQDNDDIGRVFRQVTRLNAALMFGFLQRFRSDACRWHRRKWQDRAVIRCGSALSPNREGATAKQHERGCA